MIIPELQDLALFSVALHLWEVNDDSSGNWDMLTKKVLEAISNTYPQLPSLIKYKIVNGVSLMGSELLNFVRTVRLFEYVCLRSTNSLRFNEICWTPYFTVDRAKTLLRSSDEISSTLAYDDCPSAVRESWNELNSYFLVRADRIFGKHKHYVFLHSFCHSEQKSGCDFSIVNRRVHVILLPRFFSDTVFYFEKYYTLDAHIENVFRYLVVMGDVASAIRFYAFVPADKRKENALLMANMVITELANLELNFRQPKLKIVSIFLFLWHQLENADRFEMVQTHFKQYYQFVLSYPGTDSLVKFVNWYRPTNSRKENREYLEKAVACISRNIVDHEKSRRVFHLIYNKVEMTMSEIDIVNLLETLLTVKDIDSSVFIMKKLDAEKKNKVLDVLHKIWNDLWKDFIDIDTFMTFFIEVQSHTIQLMDISDP